MSPATPADAFWLGVVGILAAIVLLMLLLACVWRLVWLITDARRSARPITDAEWKSIEAACDWSLWEREVASS